MTMNQVEELLRKAPRPKAPEELLRRLTAGIRLPQPAAAPVENWGARPLWTRRWLPALSFAAIFLVCVAVVAVQTNILSDLQRGNDEMRAAKTKLVAAQTENPVNQEAVIDNQELERLQKDNAELLKLRGEVGRLQAQLQDGPKLRAENARIKAAIAANRAVTDSDEDVAKAKARAERIACVNNLKQIGLACRLWADDNQGFYPSNFICMSNELSTWKILQCPGDKSHTVTSWADVEAGNISYIMNVTPGLKDNEPQVVFVECPIHHNICMVDGSVQQLSEERYKSLKVVDGKKVFGP